MIYRQSPTFRRSFSGLADYQKKLAKEKFELFVENPNHPSLRTKKIKGKKDIWEGHVSKGLVFTFRFLTDKDGNDVCEAIDIGNHEIYK